LDYDIVIKGGILVDGTGNPWIRTDVGVRNGKIVKVGRIEGKADVLIRAEGMLVAPGFIDIHSHDDLIFFRDVYNKPKLLQGVTTVVMGNCGLSPAPLSRETVDDLKAYLSILCEDVELNWRSYGDFLSKLEEIQPLGTNVLGLVGHGTVRIAVMGMDARDPSEEELEEMKELISLSMKEGAYGMSTGLIYPPGAYAKTEEIIELAKVVAKFGGIYSSHIRNESRQLIEAVSEAIRIGEESGVPVEISHHKAAGKKNWGKTEETLRMIEEARQRGIEVTADAYPYSAGSTYLAALLPPWAHEGGVEKLIERMKSREEREKIRKAMEEGEEWENMVRETGWDRVVLSYSPSFSEFEGKSLFEISKQLETDPYDLLFSILEKDRTNSMIIIHSMSEEDVTRVISHPYVMIGTDGLDIGVGKPHPRTYGTFPRVIRRFVREKRVLTIEEAIRKMTSMPAHKLGLKQKGLIREGYDADIVVLSQNILDQATYSNPRVPPKGIEFVIVNGVLSVERGKLLERGGRVLRSR